MADQLTITGTLSKELVVQGLFSFTSTTEFTFTWPDGNGQSVGRSSVSSSTFQNFVMNQTGTGTLKVYQVVPNPAFPPDPSDDEKNMICLDFLHGVESGSGTWGMDGRNLGYVTGSSDGKTLRGAFGSYFPGMIPTITSRKLDPPYHSDSPVLEEYGLKATYDVELKDGIVYDKTVTGEYTAGFQGTVHVTIQLKLPTLEIRLFNQNTGTFSSDSQIFHINGDDPPQMPRIEAEAIFIGDNGDNIQTPNTTFEWTVQIHDDCSPLGRNPDPNMHPDIHQQTIGSRYNVHFPSGLIRGGSLQLIVETELAGLEFRALSTGSRIRGQNPTLAVVQNALGTDTLRRIACVENHQRQFTPDGCPKYSDFGDGGVGIMQITPPRSGDEVWNWRINVTSGIDIFNHKADGVSTYLNQIRNDPVFLNLVQQLNETRLAQGLPALNINVNFTPQQFERDQIRAYNGYGHGHDQFNHRLHEFKIGQNSDGSLQIDNVNDVLHTADVRWVQVTAAERIQFGDLPEDANYVQNVLNANPQCPPH